MTTKQEEKYRARSPLSQYERSHFIGNGYQVDVLAGEAGSKFGAYAG